MTCINGAIFMQNFYWEKSFKGGKFPFGHQQGIFHLGTYKCYIITLHILF